jgi:hypothetical protein
MEWKNLFMPEHAKLHVALADDALLQQLPFADAFDALYAGVVCSLQVRSWR